MRPAEEVANGSAGRAPLRAPGSELGAGYRAQKREFLGIGLSCLPDEIYGISKWMGEQIMGRFHADRPGVRTAVARLFNTYGPRETNPHVLPEVMRALGAGKTIDLGNLWPQRDLIFVTDTAAALVAAAQGEPGLEVFNVGTGTGTTIEDVMETIGDITGRPVDVRQVPERMRDGDGHLISDPQKLMQASGWKPQYDLEAGLRRLLAAEGLL